MELAKSQGEPPYLIFHDSTLLEIVNQRPSSLTELGRISGVGQAKLARYGDDFLEVLEQGLILLSQIIHIGAIPVLGMSANVTRKSGLTDGNET